MTDAGDDIASRAWDFALRIYAEPGVADACLQLQRDAGADVIMVLMAAFAAVRRGVILGPSDAAEMDAACRAWREQVVRPLRALRTTLKSGPAPAPNAGTAQLRADVKSAELLAERLQNDMLAGRLQGTAPGPPVKSVAEIGAALDAVIEAAAAHRAASAEVPRSAIETVAAAALALSP
jgi:uncharacterized protein (TIGR02444 family)